MITFCTYWLAQHVTFTPSHSLAVPKTKADDRLCQEKMNRITLGVVVTVIVASVWLPHLAAFLQV